MGYIDETTKEGRTIERLIRFMKSVENPSWMVELVEDMRDKLAEYEDLEEQGKMLKLPCAVGDTVYRINKGAKEPIIPMKVCEVGVISLKVGGFVIQIMCRDESDNGETHYLSTDFGKTVFLTKEEAKAALKKL